MPPQLLDLGGWPEYHSHYIQTLCQGPLTAADGIDVYFKRETFYHAFFESIEQTDDSFSLVRAQRMDWISATLMDAKADRYQGWNRKRQQYDPLRRVDVVLEDFVVVLQLTRRQSQQLGAQFVTCYQADRSIAKIRQSPLWNRRECEARLFG